MKLLINKQTLNKYFQIGQGVSESDINKYIQEAQDLDLKPLLPEDFYYDLLSKSTEANYKQLIEGGEYVINGNQIRFNPGIEKVMAYFTYARLILKSHIVSTTHGFQVKQTDWSKSPESAERKNFYYSNRKDANTFLVDVKKFIEANSIDFPLWNSSTKCNTIKRYKSNVIK